MAAFVVTYPYDTIGSVRMPAVEEVTRMRPPGSSSRVAARTVSRVPVRLVAMTFAPLLVGVAGQCPPPER